MILCQVSFQISGPLWVHSLLHWQHHTGLVCRGPEVCSNGNSESNLGCILIIRLYFKYSTYHTIHIYPYLSISIHIYPYHTQHTQRQPIRGANFGDLQAHRHVFHASVYCSDLYFAFALFLFYIFLYISILYISIYYILYFHYFYIFLCTFCGDFQAP